MENNLEIKLELPPNVGKATAKSIDIEAKSYQLSRSKVKIDWDEKENFLKINIGARDLSALRAALNTYLRWVITCQELLQ